MGRFCTRSTFVAILIYSSFFKVSSFGQAQTRATAGDNEIRRFLVEQFQEPGFSNDKTTKYSYTEVDLNGDGVKEVVVYLTGRDWCGTGGCNTFILARGVLIQNRYRDDHYEAPYPRFSEFHSWMA